MGVNNPEHATLRHENLRVGEVVVVDGEKIRPRYHGTTLNLTTIAGSSEPAQATVKPA